MVKILVTDHFKRDIKSIKHEGIKEKIATAIKKIELNPTTGKPLKHVLKRERSIKIQPYRLIYAYSLDTLILLRFQHRKNVYKKF